MFHFSSEAFNGFQWLLRFRLFRWFRCFGFFAGPGLAFTPEGGSITQSFISRVASLLGIAREEKEALASAAAIGRLWLAAARSVAALAACARACGADLRCSRRVSRTCRCVAACGIVLSVVRSLCNVVQCEVVVVCVVPVAYGR